MIRPAVVLFLALALAALTEAQSSPYTPKVGSPERVAIADTLRVYVQKHETTTKLPKKIVFKIDWLKVDGDFAFFTGFPQFADGTEAIGEYLPDMLYSYLLQKESGKWEVIANFSGSDVPEPAYWKNMRKKFPPNVPATIFPKFYRDHLGM